MAEQGEQRRLAAIFAADMVGYSRLMEADERGTIARQKSHRAELIDPKIAEHHGRIVKLMGDGMLVEFPSVVDAVECAIAVQRAMAKREADVAEERRIQYRVGINLGDIVLDGGDIFGTGVNMAARLQELAEPGGIWISHSVYEQVRLILHLNCEDVGERKVKNISEPVHAYRLVIDLQDETVPQVDHKQDGEKIKGNRRWTISTIIVVLLIGGGVIAWKVFDGESAPECTDHLGLPISCLDTRD